MRFTQGGQQACNIFHVENTGAMDVAQFNVIADAFIDWWTTNLRSNTSPQTSLDAIEVTDISTSSGIGIEYTTGLPLSGTNGTAGLPQNVTVATKLSTGFTGRSKRGRSYFVGVPSNAVTSDGHITPTFQGIVDGAFEVLIDTLRTLDVPLMVLSLVTGGAPRAAGILTEVIAAAVNLAADSQRRRLPERGA